MVYKYRVTLAGIKGFYRVYEMRGETTLYEFHKQMRADMEFPQDQLIMFKAMDAGDGANQHPTQTLLDLYAIQKTQGKLNGLTVNMVGDLKYGRAVHSLVEALRWFDPHFIFTSPEELNMPKKYLELLDREGVDYRQTDRIEDGLNICDVLYMTRVQQERFPDMDEYNKVKDVYRLSASMLGSVKPNMKIMHPLPRVNEIATDIDDTPYAYYFQQAGGGMYVRMAIISYLLGYR